MRRSATRLLIVTLMGFLLALPGAASAMAESAAGVQPPPPATEPVPPTTTAPAGPELEEQDTEADRAERNRKLVMGGLSVVLVGAVVWGRSIRRKRRKAADG